MSKQFAKFDYDDHDDRRFSVDGFFRKALKSVELQRKKVFTEEWLNAMPNTYFWLAIKKTQKARNYIFKTLTDHTFSRLVRSHVFVFIDFY